ncbi:MAG: RDD family protein [Coprobacillus sp.]|nr:RDD family protein [Coprobacillus sp.]
MNAVKLYKRTLAYILDYLIWVIVSFLVLLFLYTREYVGVSMYIVYSIVGAIVLMFFYTLICEYASHGYTFFSFAFSFRIVREDQNRLKASDTTLRALLECLGIFPILDFIYLLVKRTNRGAIDRVTNTFAVSTKDFSL